MLIDGGKLEVGTAGFQLAGPGFRFAGMATIAHRTHEAVGLRILSWHGPAYRPISALVAARLPQQPGSSETGSRACCATSLPAAHARAPRPPTLNLKLAA
jgi:hypothetical protein